MTNLRSIAISLLLLWGGITQVAGAPPREAPADLAASSPLMGQASLSWTGTTGAEVYQIWRRVSGQDWAELPDRTVEPFYQDVHLEGGVDFEYAVCGVNADGPGPRSAPVKVRIQAPPVKNLKIVASEGSVSLSWDPSRGALGYRIDRYTLDGRTRGASFSIGAVTNFTDTVTGGMTYYYNVYSMGAGGVNFSFAAKGSATVPGTPALVPAAPPVPRIVDVPSVQVRAENGQVGLSWTSAGTEWAVFRGEVPGNTVLLDSGIESQTFADSTVENGKTYFYRVQTLGAGGSGPMSPEVRAEPRGPQARPWSGRLTFGLDREPEQSCAIEVPDLNRPVRGVLFLSGRSFSDLPRLREVARRFNLVQFGFEKFNFGSRANPRYVDSTPSNAVLQVDYNWPEHSHDLVQRALEKAARQFSHPEITGAAIVTYGFSAATVGLSSLLSQPGWSQRVVGMIGLGGMDGREENLGTTIPHLFLASSSLDYWSSLHLRLPEVPKDLLQSFNIPGAGAGVATYGSYYRGLATNRGDPLTILNNLSTGHGGNPDNPIISRWLESVLNQRLPVELPTSKPVEIPDLRPRAGWVGCYDVSLVSNSPLGWLRYPKVRLTNTEVSPRLSYQGSRPSIWLPGRTFALAWLEYNQRIEKSVE